MGRLEPRRAILADIEFVVDLFEGRFEGVGFGRERRGGVLGAVIAGEGEEAGERGEEGKAGVSGLVGLDEGSAEGSHLS